MIDGSIGRGMSYYFRKYNLDIGGPVHSNSHYHIIEPWKAWQ